MPTIPATADKLRQILDRRPVLWVGAGLSIAAGHPSTAALCQAMIADADVPLDPKLPFEQLADAFVAAMGPGPLGDLLQRELGGSKPLTPLHGAIARSAAAGKFAAIVTTNYDDLLERALAEAEVRYVHQVLEDNALVVDGQALRLLKLHGSRDDWQRVILSGASYAAFGGRYPFLEKQLHVLLRRHPVFFVGCSLLDPRIAGWLEGLDAGALDQLKTWRAAMTGSGWRTATAARPVLERARVNALELDDHGHLARLWHEVAPERTPAGEMALDIQIGASRLVARVDGGAEWSMANPLDDADLLTSVEALRDLGVRPVPTDRHGVVTPAAAAQVATLRRLAEAVGDALAALLSPEAAARLTALEAAARVGGRPVLLRLRVVVGDDGEALADRLLALPWELLRVAGRFPVSEHTVDLVREAVVPDLPGLGAPKDELKVVATVAAPIDLFPVDYETEIYRLWQALGPEHEGRLTVTDLGTLDELVAEEAKIKPPVIHFTGHGEPGALVFEDEAAHHRPVPVAELISRLHAGDVPLPRLIYLSTCHGATAGQGDPRELAGIRDGERMVDRAAGSTPLPSTAAALHRGGFAQVLGYFGPVGDLQATRVAAAFYGGLAAGRKARSALHDAREAAMLPLERNDGWYVYPLGWAQMALYHRGDDQPTTLPASDAVAVPLTPPERVFERMDRKGGTLRVEKRHDEPVVGVQQLRQGMGFVGRRKPRSEAIGRWRRGQRLLVVQGLGGLGKTALCAELLRLLTDGKVVALDGRWAGAQSDAIAALWQEVQAARADAAWSQHLATIQQESGLSAEGLVCAVAALAELEGELTLYLDDAESLMLAPAEGTPVGAWRDEQVAALWRGLAAMTRDGRVGVLASSRYLPTGTPPSATLRLEPMSRWEILKLMAWLPTLQRLPHADRDWLSTKIDGHPRTLEWLEVLAAQKEQKLASPDGNFRGNWRTAILEPILEKVGAEIDADLLLRLIWQALDDAAREHLGRATVLEAPAPWEAILALAPDPDDTSARRLADAGLLSPFQGPTDDSWWKPHGLVIAAIAPLWSGDPAAAHRHLGGAFRDLHATKPDPLLAQRAIEHLCAGGDGDGAWPLARLLALSLRRAGRYREALGWVERILAAGVSGPRLGMAIKVQIELTRKTGTLATDFEDRLLQALDLVEAANKGDVFFELGGLCQALGQLSAAAEYLQKAVDFDLENKGEQSFDVAASLHELARVLQAQGDLPAARRHLERSLEVKATVFGTDLHPEVAASLHALAGVLKAQGDLPAARRHLERSLEIQATVFGTDLHPDVATSLHELAGVLKAQGDLSAARRHLERSLEITATVFGTDLHPDVTASLHQLASVLQAQGDIEGARKNMEKVLSIEEKIYGSKEHYSTAITESSLGFLLLQLDEIEEGLRLLTHAYGVFQRQLGEDHPYTRELGEYLQATATKRAGLKPAPT